MRQKSNAINCTVFLSRGVVIEGAKELPVANAVDTFKALSLGSQVRKEILVPMFWVNIF